MRRTVITSGGVIALVLVAYPVSVSGFAYATVVPGILSLAGFWAALVVGRWIFSGLAALAFIATYAIALVLDTGRLDPAAPAVGFALLLLLELCDLVNLMARGGIVDRDSLATRLRYILTICAVGLIVSFGALLAAGWLEIHHYLLVILGAACGLAAVGLAVLLARRAVGAGTT
jgi:hypothetical protein